MIKLQPISTSDLQHYKFMEELLVDAFPPEEYRQLEELREYTDRTGNFHNNIIFDDDLPIGFITYWDFDRFYYVDFFVCRTLRHQSRPAQRRIRETDVGILVQPPAIAYRTGSRTPRRGNGKTPYLFLRASRIHLVEK